MADKTYKRREILVNRKVQLGMSLSLIAWIFVYVVAFAFVSNAASMWTVVIGSESDPGYTEAVERLRWFAQSTLLPLGIAMVCVAAHCLLFTHRIAGPVHRFKVVFSELAAGRFPERPVTLRDGDYFTDVAAELNKAVETQREDAASRRRVNDETCAAIRELRAAIDESRLAKPELLALADLALDRAESRDRRPAVVEPAGASASAPAGASSVPDPTSVAAEVAGR